MPRDEGGLLHDDLVDTNARMEVGLDGRKDGDRAVSASATAGGNLLSHRATTDDRQHLPEYALFHVGNGDTDGVVEGQAKGLVRIFTTLAAVEQVRLNVFTDGEQVAARSVGRRVHAVGASDPSSEGACNTAMPSKYRRT